MTNSADPRGRVEAPVASGLSAVASWGGCQSGWRRAAVAFGFGAGAAVALPPVHAVPLLLPAFTGLLWQIDGAQRLRDAAAIGYCFGLGFFAVGLYWVGHAFLVDAARHAWAAPIAVTMLVAGMALFPAAVAATVRLVLRRPAGPSFGPLVLAAAWTLFEWVRGWFLTGFPWNLIATAWTFSDAMIQFAAVGGALGLGFVTVAVASTPASLASVRALHGRPRATGWRVAAVAVAATAILWGWGAWRITGDDGVVPDVRLRLVQPAIPQHLKWRRDLRRGHVLEQLRLSGLGPSEGRPPTHVVWAETAVPYYLNRDRNLRTALGAAAASGGALIVGAPRAIGEGEAVKAANSIHAIDPTGEIVATYDKAHLVPFGEYVPLRGLFRFSKLTAGRGDFTPGPGPATLRIPGLPPVSPLICYEVIFAGQVVDRNGPRPSWMLNLTNDAWFGRSSGPYQHLAAARLRSVEEGLPLVRVANTGISAVIDGRGRLRSSLGLGESGVLDADLPRAVAPPPFARFGSWPVLVLIVAVLTVAFTLERRRVREKTICRSPFLG